MFLSEQLVATYRPEGSICTWEAESKVLCYRGVYGGGRGQWGGGGEPYPEQAAIFTQRTLVQLLLFTAADVENPAATTRTVSRDSNPWSCSPRCAHALTWCIGLGSQRQRTCRWGRCPCHTGWISSLCGGNVWTLCPCQSAKQTETRSGLCRGETKPLQNGTLRNYVVSKTGSCSWAIPPHWPPTCKYS